MPSRPPMRRPFRIAPTAAIAGNAVAHASKTHTGPDSSPVRAMLIDPTSALSLWVGGLDGQGRARVVLPIAANRRLRNVLLYLQAGRVAAGVVGLTGAAELWIE